MIRFVAERMQNEQKENDGHYMPTDKEWDEMQIGRE